MRRKKNPNGEGRFGRDKKEKALKTDEYKANIQLLSELGVTAEDIQKIYDRCQERPQTKIARDTLVLKLINYLNYIFEHRNQGINEDEPAYISKSDAIEMIMRNPRIISSDINNNIIAKCELLTTKKDGNRREANKLIKSNPGVFRKSYKNIKEGR